MTALSVKCPHCGSTNDFNIQGSISAIDEVGCSHCRMLIGLWGDLFPEKQEPAQGDREKERGRGAA